MRAATLVVALTVVFSAQGAAAKPSFHAAQSAPELALARILKLDGDQPEKVDPAIATGHRPRTTPPPGAAYLKYLTTPLAVAILAAEAREVRANCGGVY